MPQGVETAAELGHPQLRVGVPGVVVVRIHDHSLGIVNQRRGHCRHHGHLDPDHGASVHFPIRAQLGSVDARGQ